MTATQTVSATVSLADVFKFEDEEKLSPWTGYQRRYKSFSHLSDEEYDKELNARGVFPWLHLHEVLGFDPFSTATGSLVEGYSIDDYNTWK